MSPRIAMTSLVLVLGCNKATPALPSGEADAALVKALLDEPAKGPQLLVTIARPGASTLEVERQLLVPIERAISSVDDIDEIESVATPSRGRIYVSFASGVDPLAASQSLRAAMPSDTLPVDAVPTIERADRNGGLMFVLLSPASPEAGGAGPPDAMEALRLELMQQPGVWKVQRCGFARQVLVVEPDPSKLSAYGLTIDRVIAHLESNIDMGLSSPRLDDVIPAVESPIDGTVRLDDIAVIRIQPREHECKVIGAIGNTPRMLQIWGTTEGIASARRAVGEGPLASRARVWVPGDPAGSMAIVASMLPRDEARAVMMRWLASDTHAPAWLVQDGDDPAWLLAAPRTSLLSFSMAAREGLHMWWPGAPPPVTVRLCGPDLDTLGRATHALAGAVQGDDLLDDVTAWVPSDEPQVVVDVDRERAAMHGLSFAEVARAGALASGAEQRLSDRVTVRVPSSSSTLLLRGNSGPVLVRDLVTMRQESVPAFISRVDGQRCNAVDLQPRRAEDRAKIEALVREKLDVPVGMSATIVPL